MGTKKAVKTTKQRYGKEFYRVIGSIGGKLSGGKFEKGSERAREAGRRGGINKGTGMKL